MKKVTAFVGSARKMFTYEAASGFLDRLRALGGVETEIVRLSEYPLGQCLGCKLCFEKGEEFCPQKDRRDLLLTKMKESDGVVLATPNYSFHVSGFVKTFLDRTSYTLHRPDFFGKAFAGIVSQGKYGGGKILKYLDFVARGMGFNIVPGSCFTALEPMTDKERRKMDARLVRLAQRFHARLARPAFPAPSLFWLFAFRMGRTSVKLDTEADNRDLIYYREKGWLDSDYYYPVRLGPVKKLSGRLFDALAARMMGKNR